MELAVWLRKAALFQQSAHSIFSKYEDSHSRIISLSSSYSLLTRLNLKQDDLFRQALNCAEQECFRAAHVMGWAAFMDFLQEKCMSDSGLKLTSVRPDWKIKDVDDLRENIVEYQLIEATRSIGLCTKSEMKALLGLLNKRNECAHPTNYYPGLNETLGFLSELLDRINHLQKKSL